MGKLPDIKVPVNANLAVTAPLPPGVALRRGNWFSGWLKNLAPQNMLLISS